MAHIRSPHTAQVGEWIALRRAELGLTQRELAERVTGAPRDRTVSNVETGRTAVALRTRPAWERVLGWPAGSLTAAYKRGVRPAPSSAGGDVATDDAATRLLARADVPATYHAHPDVRAVLDAGELSDGDRVSLLQVWLANRRAYEQTYERAALRARSTRQPG